MPPFAPALFYTLVYCALAYLVHLSMLFRDRHEGNPVMPGWLTVPLALLWPLTVFLGAIILMVVGADYLRGDH